MEDPHPVARSLSAARLPSGVLHAFERRTSDKRLDFGDGLVIIFPCRAAPAEAVADPEGTLAEELVPHDDTPETPIEKFRERRASDLSDFRVVKFEPGEQSNPQNWSEGKKWFWTMFGSFLVLNATLASSAPSGVATLMAEYFDASHMQVTLIISLFVLGYVVGPLIWAPLSEVFGRRPVYMISFAGYTAFNLGCALATTIGEMLAFRFLAGTFAAAPITNSGGVLTDIWEPKDRGRPMAYFGLAPFAGPVLGPAISGFMGMRFGSHQPLFWLLFAFSGVCFVALLWMPETYGPVLLRRRAERLREETGRTVDECRAPIEASGRTIGQVVATSFARPLSFLATELIVSLVTLYTSFVYGVLYLLFGTFPIVFVGIYHFNPGQSGIAFLSIGIGAFFSILVLNRVFNALYLRRPDPHGRLVPEWRLPSCFVGGPLFALSMFWFGWTANPSIHWIVPALAGIPMGAGVVGVFTATQSYLADCYGIYAASAIAANTVARSTFGFAFPLFSQQMYGSLGVAWASTVLGFAGLALVPVPFLFFRYGERIRARSKFARS